MSKVKICIIGAGNISNTRHIPALKKVKEAEITGVLSNKLERAQQTAAKHRIRNIGTIDDSVDKNVDILKKLEWFAEVDAVVIGAPPHLHFPLVKAALTLGKHVLVEKPMTMNTAEAGELVKFAKKQKKQFCVMHNFQFASGMQKLAALLEKEELGKIISFDEFQLTNKHRRLPEWYNDLPLGLFFDEAPHFMYLLEKFGGRLNIESSYAHPSTAQGDNTPTLLSVSLKAGDYPAHIFLNFEAPICEWFFVVSGSNKIAIYDLFKDILIILPTDNEHYAMDILRNSRKATTQYWSGFIKNGFRMVSGNLLYGHEVVMDKFVNAIVTNTDVDPAINGEAGARTVKYMEDIVRATEQNIRPNITKSGSRK